MPDSFASRVFLQTLEPSPDSAICVRYSPGSKRRASQLGRFVQQLQQQATSALGMHSKLELLVLQRRDWQQVVSYPYGLPFVRNHRGSSPFPVSIVAAADYPGTLLQRWPAIALRASQQGSPAPGDVREFFDLLIGHEWGHAAANVSGLRSRIKWVDELMATYLFLAALREDNPALLQRFIAWAACHVAGSHVQRADLGAFEYPKGRLRFEDMLWFQGTFSLRAAALLAERGWDFPRDFQAALEQQSSRQGKSDHRGNVSRALLEVEPSFREWFSIFAVAPS